MLHISALAGTSPEVRPLDPGREADWDDFVRRSGTFFHLAGWRRIFEEIFGFRTHYLWAQEQGRMTGVLPLVHQKSILFGSGLIAAPFCVEGGPAGDPAACQALEDEAKRMMRQKGCSFLEFRSRLAGREGWQVKKDLYATFKRPLAGDEEGNLKAIPRKQRAVVRKALQSALTAQIHEQPDVFYAIYARSVQNLGTPVFPLRYFQRLCEVFAGQLDILVIYDRDTPVSAVLNFYFGDTVMPYYGGGLASARQ